MHAFKQSHSPAYTHTCSHSHSLHRIYFTSWWLDLSPPLEVKSGLHRLVSANCSSCFFLISLTPQSVLPWRQNSLSYKPDCITPLLKNIWWFLIAHRIKREPCDGAHTPRHNEDQRYFPHRTFFHSANHRWTPTMWPVVKLTVRKETDINQTVTQTNV